MNQKKLDNETKPPAPLIHIDKQILLNNSQYLLSITSNENKDGILIKLTEKLNNIYYLYEASKEQIIKDIKALVLCESIDEMIESLKELVETKKVKFEQKEDNYIMNFEFSGIGIKSKSQIELIKHEPFNPIVDLNKKFEQINIEYQKLNEEINELKNKSIEGKKETLNEEQIEKIIKLNLKEKIKEILQDQEIKNKLFEEFEKKMSEKFIKKEDNEKTKIYEEKKNNKEEFENIILEKIQKSVKELIDEKFIDKIDEKKLKENLEKLKQQFKKKGKKLIKSNQL